MCRQTEEKFRPKPARMAPDLRAGKTLTLRRNTKFRSFRLSLLLTRHDSVQRKRRLSMVKRLFSRSPRGGRCSGKDKDVGRTEFILGKTHLSAGNLEAAVRLLSESLHSRQATLGVFHKDVAETLYQLARCHHEMKNNKKALNLLEISLRIYTAVSGSKEDIEKTLHLTGTLQQEMGRTDEAIKSFTEAMKLKRNLYGKDHIEYARSLQHLALALEQGNLLEDARIAYTKALGIRRAALGSSHVDVATTMHHLGNIHKKMGHLVKSQTSYCEALGIRRKLLGGSHQDYARTLHNLGVVRKELGDADGAMKAFTEAVWVSNNLNVNAPSAEAISERCRILFGAATLTTPLESARIFSCVSLLFDTIVSPDANMDWTRPLLPLLKAFVDTELAILGSITQGNSSVSSDDNDEDDGKRSRMVQFCACDCSALAPPVDMNLGSHKQLEHGVDALDNVMTRMKSFLLKHSGARATGSAVENTDIAKWLLGLHALASEEGGEHLRRACSAAMPRIGGRLWPASRFVRAAQLYTAEIEAIAARLETTNGAKEFHGSSVTPFRYRFANMVRSSIRFHLRRLFDFPPLGYTVPYGDFSACRARTHEVVCFSAPEGMSLSNENGDPKLWQSPISVVFCVALRHVYSLLLSYDSIKEVFQVKGCSDSTNICPTSITNQKPRRRSWSAITQVHRLSSPRSLGDVSPSCEQAGQCQDDAHVSKEILTIQLARVTLAGARAADFLLSLLSWPGVESCITEAGGWYAVERLAKKITTHNLGVDSPEEEHFALLQRMDHLQILLKQEAGNLVALSRVADQLLRGLEYRYKGVGLRKVTRNESTCLIRSMLMDDETTIPVFPALSSPDYMTYTTED